MYKEFHIWDFPLDKVRILLIEDFRKRLFKSFISLYGSEEKACKAYGFCRNRFYCYKFGKNFIKLDFLLRISEILSNRGFVEFSKENIEKEIKAIKSYGAPNNYSIENPILPIKEDENLIRLIAYLMGDGYAGERAKGKIKGQVYTNKNQEVIGRFIKCIRVFGNSPIRKKFDANGGYSRYRVYFISLVVHLIKYFYENIDFRSHSSKLPNSIINLPKELKAELLGAFIDDEATIDESYVEITLVNKVLLLQLRKIFNSLGILTSDIKLVGNRYFKLRIYNLKKIKETVAISHDEKINELNYIINRPHYNTKKRTGKTKTDILELLSKGSYNAKELSKILNITKRTIRLHLRELKKQNLIKITYIKGRVRYYKRGG